MSGYSLSAREGRRLRGQIIKRRASGRTALERLLERTIGATNLSTTGSKFEAVYALRIVASASTEASLTNRWVPPKILC